MSKKPKSIALEQNKIAMQKQIILDNWMKSFGIITAVVKTAGITRQTFYDWYRNDEQFRNDIDAQKPDEAMVDVAEMALMKELQKGNITAIIFTLKTKGKKRGWMEEISQTLKIENLPQLVIVKPDQIKSPIYDEAEITNDPIPTTSTVSK